MFTYYYIIFIGYIPMTGTQHCELRIKSTIKNDLYDFYDHHVVTMQILFNF